MSMLDHPSIAGRIQLLEQEVQAKQDNIDSLRTDFSLLQKRYADYAEQVKNVLFDLYGASGHDEDTILAVMRNLNIDTRTTKKFEVNVSFEIEVEYALGEEVGTNAFEWDINYEVNSDEHEITDYRADVIYVNEV